MAKEPKQANAPKIEFDALTKKLVPDPATIPDSVALTGFIGRSAEDGKYSALFRLELSKLLRNLDLRYSPQSATAHDTISIGRIGRLRQGRRSSAAGAGFNGNRSPVSAGPDVECRRGDGWCVNWCLARIYGRMQLYTRYLQRRNFSEELSLRL